MNGYNDPFTLKGKNIFVTGASSGIGKEIAIACSKMGANVFITARREKLLRETLSLMEGGQNNMFSTDLINNSSINQLVAWLPRLDGIVHCAGIGHAKLCRQIEEKDIDKVFSINFNAPVLLQGALLKQKKINKEASIIFIASNTTGAASIGNATYSASKGALIAYANCLKVEVAPRKIRVNCISPGMVETDLITHDGISREDLSKDEANYLFKRYGQPKDITGLALYLLSDASSWMTGQNIEISGGCPKL
ncbi:SDR family NAD(P)-dependent oxidoreductase [Prevotella nigrescens]